MRFNWVKVDEGTEMATIRSKKNEIVCTVCKYSFGSKYYGGVHIDIGTAEESVYDEPPVSDTMQEAKRRCERKAKSMLRKIKRDCEKTISVIDSFLE